MNSGLRRSTPSSIAMVAVLGGCLVLTFLKPSSESTAPFHARVAEAFDAAPLEWEAWRGEVVDAPVGVEMLQPTALICRRYTHAETNEQFLLLLIHSGDARHLVGHTPSVCYPASGWRMIASGPVALPVESGGPGDTEFMEYRFGSPSAFGGDIVVANLTLLPLIGLSNDATDVDRVAAQPQARLLGASQIQLVFSPQVARERRHAIVAEFLRALHDPVSVVTRGDSLDS